MRHMRNLLIFIGGSALSAITVGVFFLLLSFMLPDLVAQLGHRYEAPPDLALGRQYFCTIGLVVGGLLGLVFMTISMIVGSIKRNKEA